MNILYTNFHPTTGGGHTTYVLSLVNALKHKHKISVAAPESSTIYQSASLIPEVTGLAMPFTSRITKLPAIWNERKILREFIHREKIDVVHVNGSADHRMIMYSLCGMTGTRPRVVWTKHNSLPIGNGFGPWLRSTNATDHVIAVAECTRTQLLATSYARCGVTTVTNGIDLDYFRPLEPAEITQFKVAMVGAENASKLIIGSNAGTADYKNWLDMVRAVALLPEHERADIHVLVAGERPTNAAWDEISALGMTSQFTYAGHLSDTRSCIGAFDVGFVLSDSVETISFACREMMAMGKPVIITDYAGLPENVTHNINGWIVPTRSPLAIRDRLKALLLNRGELASAGLAAMKTARSEFSLKQFVQRTEDVYLAVVQGR